MIVNEYEANSQICDKYQLLFYVYPEKISPTQTLLVETKDNPTMPGSPGDIYNELVFNYEAPFGYLDQRVVETNNNNNSQLKAKRADYQMSGESYYTADKLVFTKLDKKKTSNLGFTKLDKKKTFNCWDKKQPK
jgi:hypothetical protein